MTDFHGRRILVVDDEAANRRLIQAILAPEGGTIVHAADGASALAMMREQCIDLVLLDVMMPGIDGIEVCQRIRDRSRGSYVPVVLVTALADADSRARGKAAGADDFLTKPVHEDELLARARNLLRMRAYHEVVQLQHVEAAREAARWRLTSEVAGAVAVCRDYRSLLAQIGAALATQLPIDYAGVLDVEGDQLVVRAVAGAGVAMPDEVAARHDSPPGWREALVAGARRIDTEVPFAGMLAAQGFADGIAIPVFGAGALHGVFVVARRGAFSDDDLAVFRQLAPHVGNAINNVRLHLRAEGLLRSREELTQLIVHDLRNPLSAALTNVELALEDELPPDERTEVLGDARRATQRVVALVSDLLDASAAEEGRLRLVPRIQDLGALACAVAEQCAPPVYAAYALSVTTEPDLFSAIDGKLMARVLENIIGNATRFVPTGGRIAIAARRVDDGVAIAISNDGPGISDAVRGRLFHKYGGDASTVRTRGLGLYFCRLVVEAHGGSIAEIAPAAGVCFEIRLPVAGRTRLPSRAPQLAAAS